MNMTKLLSDFSAKLLEKNILNTSDLSLPNNIYDKLEAERNKVAPDELDIEFYIPKKPLNDYLETIDLLKITDGELSEIALFTYYQVYSEKYAEFEITLNENRTVSYNNNDLPIPSFESVLFEEIAKRKDKHVTVRNSKIIIKANPYTQMTFVNFIMSKVREIGIYRVEFKKQ